MHFHHQQEQRLVFLQQRSLWSAPTMLALCKPEAVLPAQSGRSTATLLTKSPLSPLFQRGGPKSPLCKGGRAKRGGILARCDRKETFASGIATLALLLSQAMLGTVHGRSTASPGQSGSTAPALQKAAVYGQLAAPLLVFITIFVSMTGCAVVKATNQPDKKNLSVFSAGTPRSYVIAEVGAPTFTEEKDGQRMDIFTFKQGYSKGAKVGRAFFHGAADLMTLGMWEVVGTPFEAIADGTDMKIQVTYEQDRVKDVTYLAGR